MERCKRAPSRPMRRHKKIVHSRLPIDEWHRERICAYLAACRAYPHTMTLTAAAKSALLLALMAVPSLSHADTGMRGNLNVALTFTTSGPGLFQRNATGGFVLDENKKKIPVSLNKYTSVDGLTTYVEQGAKLVNLKYGTRELLEDLLESGAFPIGETSIKGWTLIAVEGNPLQNFRVFIFKTGTRPVDVTYGVSAEIIVRAFAGKASSKVVKTAEGPVKSTTAAGGLNFKSTVNFKVSVRRPPVSRELTLSGIGSGTIKLKYLPDNVSTSSLLTLSSSNLHGGYGNQMTGLGGILAQGSVSITSPTVVEDMDIFDPER